MRTVLKLLALPLLIAATTLNGTACAASIRDQANLFSSDAVRQAQAELDRVERQNRIPITIETVPSLDGQPIDEVLTRYAEKAGARGLYVLIAKKEGKLRVVASKRYRDALGPDYTRPVSEAFVAQLKKRDFDAALRDGVRTIGTEVSLARAESPVANGRVVQGGRRLAGRPAANPNGSFGIGSLLRLGILVFGVLFVLRMLGGLFGGRQQYSRGAPGRIMGGPGGFGQPGYGGGGGGGFFSSMFGGIGGALAGNWLYDQFSGRHQGGGNVENSAYDPGTNVDANAGPDDWGGGGGTDADWGGGGGGNDAGGDWGGGGGDGGAGGDW